MGRKGGRERREERGREGKKEGRKVSKNEGRGGEGKGERWVGKEEGGVTTKTSKEGRMDP